MTPPNMRCSERRRAIAVSREKNEMCLEATGQGKAPIFAMGRDQFYSEGGLFLSFRTNTSGMVTEVIVRTEGKEHRALRK
jgi:hypothetical protein